MKTSADLEFANKSNVRGACGATIRRFAKAGQKGARLRSDGNTGDTNNS